MTTEEAGAAGSNPPRRTPRQGVGGSPLGSTLSIVLAVVAVVAGFLILRNITDDGDSGGSGIDTETTVPGTVVDTVVDTTTTTTEPPLVTTGATVLVANASGVPGSAGRMSDELAAQGFTMGTPTNSTSGGLEESIVYYDPAVAAAQPVADSVARLMGGLVVQTVPTPIPVTDATLNGAGVLVMLGTAQADKTITELSAPQASVITAPPVAGGTTTGTAAEVTATTGG
jgi:hypothetical protein